MNEELVAFLSIELTTDGRYLIKRGVLAQNKSPFTQLKQMLHEKVSYSVTIDGVF